MNNNVVIMETRRKETRIKGVIIIKDSEYAAVLSKYLQKGAYTDINPINERVLGEISVFAKDDISYRVGANLEKVAKQISKIVSNLEKVDSENKISIFSLMWNDPRAIPTKDIIFIFDCINKGIKPLLGRW